MPIGGINAGRRVARTAEEVARESSRLRQTFDAKEGLGAVPNNQDVDYFGFTRDMSTKEFLGTAAKLDEYRPSSLSRIRSHLDSGGTLGPLFLNVKWDPDNQVWLTIGHEGRHRAAVLSERFSDEAKMQVHVFPQGMRSRDLTPEMLKAPILKEGQTMAKGFSLTDKKTGQKIPFRAGTDVEKAKEWAKNYLRNDYKVSKLQRTRHQDDPFRGENEWVISDPNNGNNQVYYEVIDNEYHVTWSFASGSDRGKGIGAGMYRFLFDKAIKEKKRVHSDVTMSPHSIAVWRRLKQLGYPVIEHGPFTPDDNMMYMNRDGSPLFTLEPKAQ